MAFERFWLTVPSRLFTADGGEDGLITIETTSGFKVKQKIKVSATGLPDQVLEVKRVVSPTRMYVGQLNRDLKDRSDLSTYTVVNNSSVSAQVQKRTGISREDHERAVYEEEPTLAKRVINVDQWGRFWSVDNPFPVQLSDGSIDIGTVNAELEVQLSHRDDYPDIGDIHDSVRIGGASGQEAEVTNNALDVNIKSNVAVDKTTPQILNVSAPLANNEYSFTIPANAKSYEVSCRGTARIQYAFISGQSGTNYKTIHAGYAEPEEGLNRNTALNIYFRVNKPNQIIEVKVWS